MGYFRKKLDRGRARDLAREFHDHALEGEGWRLWSGERWSDPSRRWYLRFAVAEQHPYSRRRRGVFTAAYPLLEGAELSDDLAAQLERTLRWFSENLPVPDLDEERAIFFFKSDHDGCLHRIWDLVWVLREQDLHVTMLRVPDPGRVVYEDEFQVASIPWADGEVP